MVTFALFVFFMGFKIKIKVDLKEKEIMCVLLKAWLSGISSLTAQASLVEASYITSTIQGMAGTYHYKVATFKWRAREYITFRKTISSQSKGNTEREKSNIPLKACLCCM